MKELYKWHRADEKPETYKIGKWEHSSRLIVTDGRHYMIAEYKGKFVPTVPVSAGYLGDIKAWMYMPVWDEE